MKLKWSIGSTVFLFLLLFACSNEKPVREETGKKEGSKAADSIHHANKNYLADCKKLFAAAKKMDSILLQQMEIDVVSSRQAIVAFTDFAFYCRDDSMAPVFLIKTAQVARAANNIPQAKVALERCMDYYPSFKDRAAAIFLLAQLYDEKNQLDNEAEAKRLYQKIIDEYPKSDWASSAKGAIGFIGKSDEEILKELKKRTKSDPTLVILTTNKKQIMNTPKQFITIGILGAIAVTLGAMGAHSLKSQLPSGLITVDQLNGFDTGVKYQMYHTLGMLLILILKNNYSNKFLNWSYNLFFVGIIMFSGSLYFLCTRNLINADWLKFLGPITPIGGLCFIAGWLCLGFSAYKKI